VAGFQPANYQTKAHLRGYSELGPDGLTLKLLWILRTLLMLRTMFIVLVLAALSVTSANGSPVPPAKTHKSAPAAAISHKKTHHKAAHPIGRATGHLAGRRATGREIGHAALRKQVASGKQRTKLPEQRFRSRQTRQANRAREAKSPSRIAEHSTRKTETASRTAELPASEAEIAKAEAPVSETEVPAIEAEIAPSEAEISFMETKALGRQAVSKPVSLHGGRAVVPPPLVGSHESLARQNEKSEADNLERIEDEDDLADRIARKLLVPVPASAALTVNGNLPENHRYCRPWTASFLTDLARAHAAQFHRPLEVSSAVRTVDYQKRLMGINGNAAAAEGDIVSPHVTGATIDIAKQGLSRQEVGWMRSRLLALEQAGKIDVEEEFQQSCFHITVYKSYVPPVPAHRTGPQKTGQGRAGHRKAGQPKTEPQTPDTSAQIASRGR